MHHRAYGLLFACFTVWLLLLLFLHCLVFKQIEKSTPCYPQQFQFLPFQGCVNLTAPDNLFALLLDYGNDPNEAPPSPQRLFFGRLVRIQKSSI